MNTYHWPPTDTDTANEWCDDHPFDGVAYAALWTHSGMGYGPAQAKEEWPECPGFDFEDGLPDWDCGIEEDYDYEYRTVLCIWAPSMPATTKDGWHLVATFNVNPEPSLYDEDGNPCGYVYVGEGAAEAVYRRMVEEDDDE